MFDLYHKYKDTFRKIFLTLLILGAYKIISLIVLPGVNLELVKNSGLSGGFFKTLSVLFGGGLEKCSILAVNIMPYITATIITQMLSSSVGLAYFQNLKKNRELGAAKMNEWTQYFTLGFSIIYSIYLSTMIYRLTSEGMSAVYISKPLFFVMAIPTLVAGSLIVVWFSNQISQLGMQGQSMIIFANVVSSSGGTLSKLHELYKTGVLTWNHIIALGLFVSILFIFVVFVENCTRYIDIKYPGIGGKHVIQQLPLKVNNAGIMPSILASALLNFPQILSSVLKIVFHTESLDKYISYFSHHGVLYYIFFSLLLFLLTTTQSEISLPTDDMAKNLHENEAVVNGKRPGEETERYLAHIISRLNIIAGVYLVIVCVLSEYFCDLFNQSVGTKVLNLSGTSVLIIVSTTYLIFKGIQHYDYDKLTKTIYKK